LAYNQVLYSEKKFHALRDKKNFLPRVVR
jgi:hypothetical protein